jgi:Spy/CpxP family protein refolding chaperone
MKPRISRWMVGAAVAAVAMAAPVALVFAQGQDRPMRGARGGRDGSRLAAALELTTEQQATWKELHQKHQTEMKASREQGMALHKALRETVDAANPDATAIGKAHIALKKHQDKMKAAREEFQKELEATLTEEQKTKFEAIQALRPRWRGPRLRSPTHRRLTRPTDTQQRARPEEGRARCLL